MTSSERYTGSEYEADNPTWHEEDSPWKAAQISAMIDDNHLQFQSCVEIGCGAGQILRSLARTYPEAQFTGWDIAAGLTDRWTAIKGVDFRCGDVTSTGDRYELALSIDVFEHVEDYIGFIRACRPLAKSHIFHIPLEMHVSGLLRDRQLHSRSRIGHLHYFSRATAIATLTDAGYHVIDERYTSGVLELQSAQRPVTRLANLVRRAAETASVAASAKLLGGYSLLVLAE